eukprot:TRINITY_DN3751_c0_g1_i2.p1 TRINITY_DN3751_c0_g1~~TRINITY_DN3751_c0_g1_i2.p1  ORF type:complete len:235 (-),score=43.75 TRINITY_DN3751_c0_g1_i2:216-920(-)
MAREGANVVFGDINEKDSTEFVEEWNQKKLEGHGELSYVPYEATCYGDAQKLVSRTIERYGKLDVLVNNVGIQPKNVPCHLLDEEIWDRIMSVNIKSYFLMCKAALPHMISRNCGSIINISSIQAIASQRGVSAYAASKGAILAFTRQLSVEYGQYNIRANSISPGTIATPLGADNTSFDYATSNTPLGRIGQVSDVAQTIIFLSCLMSKHITGQNLVVDGGITIKGGWSDLHS